MVYESFLAFPGDDNKVLICFSINFLAASLFFLTVNPQPLSEAGHGETASRPGFRRAAEGNVSSARP